MREKGLGVKSRYDGTGQACYGRSSTTARQQQLSPASSSSFTQKLEPDREMGTRLHLHLWTPGVRRSSVYLSIYLSVRCLIIFPLQTVYVTVLTFVVARCANAKLLKGPNKTHANGQGRAGAGAPRYDDSSIPHVRYSYSSSTLHPAQRRNLRSFSHNTN